MTGFFYYDSPQNLSNFVNFSRPGSPLAWGFVHKTYVISLPHRDDRRVDIDKLMAHFEVENWVYHDGTYANTPFIKDTMRHVQSLRASADYSTSQTVHLPFSWPEDSEETYVSNQTITSAIPLSGSELWRADSVKDVVMPEEPLICAEDNFRLEKFSEELPQWRYLTTERVATYHSHLTAVRRIVDDNTKLGVDLHREPGKVQDHIALVLEDDIDMEVDIKARMAELMPLLPYDWDMLFLGFCWSKETEHAEIIGEYSRPIKNHLHPSFQPRCLHAYALSPAGAVRLLKHLRHPPYAYGRSVDLATEWLVWEKRLKSFTVVPPVIIQRKVTKTDITLVGGAHWPESLENGVLGTTGDEI
ncbi:hypothetical protein K435DRAFT_656838 [Dendrothele bispora CBS 962.96]|uniref:Glycosyltransferase family 25 protein n=1 Tax=Dendrothele bispora (strain CBS 962.96) TaxID=1314807 RepID=A0A4S8MDJ2_DENBC|nr:hypothetical protein K435DRAFT_656838 [Dendrothele bispora CBS 962.96]